MAFNLLIACGIFTFLMSINTKVKATPISLGTPKNFLEAHFNHSLVSSFVFNLYSNLVNGMPIDIASGIHNHRRDMHFVDTVRSYPAFGSFEGRAHLVHKFNLSTSMPSTETLRVAEMHLTLPSTWSHVNTLYITTTSTSPKDVNFTSSTSVMTLYNSTINGPNGSRIQILDVTKMISEWLKFIRNDTASTKTKNESLLTINVILMGVNHRKLFTRSKILKKLEHFRRDDELKTNDDVQHQHQAMLVVYTEVGHLPSNLEHIDTHSLHRKKRMSDNLEDRLHERTTNKSSKNIIENNLYQQQIQCRRKDLDVDFTAIGWGEWVVYPTHYNAFQCQGRCSQYADSSSNPTNHAIVQSLVRLIGHDDFPTPCCAPTKLSPLSILYMEKGSVVIKYHEDMIVEECGCM